MSSNPTACDVAFLGLGVMGYPMAGHLARAGHRVTVYNRTTLRAERFVAAHRQHGSRFESTPAAAAAGANFVFVCVGNDDDVRAVAHGELGALAGMRSGATLVDHTTASAALARELDAACRERGLCFLDAPVSGGQAGAEKGALTIMCGGDAETFAHARPVFDAYAKAVTHLGPAGSGQLTKMVNQLCIAGLVEGLAEGLHFAERAGLDPRQVIAAISRGAAQSWQMDNRAETMIEGRFDFGFAVQWMRKDLGIALDEARRNGATLPVAALVDQLYAEVEAMGGGRWDTSSLIARLRRGAQAN
jgi:3-hydroxyisobutyrate dehydrogenase-like beta-hydroxyacid dehydrogenase